MSEICLNLSGTFPQCLHHVLNMPRHVSTISEIFWAFPDLSGECVEHLMKVSGPFLQFLLFQQWWSFVPVVLFTLTKVLREIVRTVIIKNKDQRSQRLVPRVQKAVYDSKLDYLILVLA